jgi:peptide/nickel transport system ATP-binding protein
VLRRISDSVSVLRAGRIVETGSVEAIFAKPSSPYTRELIEAVPGWALSGEVQQRER